MNILVLLRELGIFVLGSLAAILVAVGVLVGISLFRDALARSRRAQVGRVSEAARLRGLMRRMARPTLLLVPAREPAFSKLGGDPELPTALEWPLARGAPAQFLAQIDLGGRPTDVELPWLPPKGRLFFFFDPDGYGAPDQVKVRFDPSAEPESTMPQRLARPFRERRVALDAYSSLPSLDWLNVAEIDVSDEELDELTLLPNEPFGDELQHRIGGYPDEIQGGCLRLECEHLARGLPAPDPGVAPPSAVDRASREWRLLMQIDSDPALGLEFGDGGRLYVFVRERHARAGDFSKTVTLSQCY